jgi:hypothetical protein
MPDPLDGYWFVDIEDGVLALQRTGKRSTDMEAFLKSFDGVYAALGTATPGETDLLIDLRLSVGRNDPEFETQLVERRRELFRRFRRSCVLVLTAIGRLQVQRHVDEDGFGDTVRVFSDETAARAWLRKRPS